MKGINVAATAKRAGTSWVLPDVAEENAAASANNPTGSFVGSVAGGIPATIGLGALGAGAATALGAGARLARVAGGALPGAVRGFSSGMQNGGEAGNVIANTLGGAAIGGVGAGLVSPALETTVAGALKNAPSAVANAAGNAAGSLGYAAVDIGGRAAIGAATGNKIDLTQELANIPADMIMDIFLGGKIDISKKAKADIVTKNIIKGADGNAVIDVDGIRADVDKISVKQDIKQDIKTKNKRSKRCKKQNNLHKQSQTSFTAPKRVLKSNLILKQEITLTSHQTTRQKWRMHERLLPSNHTEQPTLTR